MYIYIYTCMNIHTYIYSHIYSMRHTFLHLTPFISHTSRHSSQRDMTYADNEATILCGPLVFPHLSRPWQYLHGGTLIPLAGNFFCIFEFGEHISCVLNQKFHRMCVC